MHWDECGFGERQTLVVTDGFSMRMAGCAEGGFAVGPELKRTLTAARTLAAALDTVDGVGMPPEVRGMRVVMDRKRELSRLRDRFVGQAADFLTVRDSRESTLTARTLTLFPNPDPRILPLVCTYLEHALRAPLP